MWIVSKRFFQSSNPGCTQEIGQRVQWIAKPFPVESSSMCTSYPASVVFENHLANKRKISNDVKGTSDSKLSKLKVSQLGMVAPTHL